jgi:hypothetical protein
LGTYSGVFLGQGCFNPEILALVSLAVNIFSVLGAQLLGRAIFFGRLGILAGLPLLGLWLVVNISPLSRQTLPLGLFGLQFGLFLRSLGLDRLRFHRLGLGLTFSIVNVSSLREQPFFIYCCICF